MGYIGSEIVQSRIWIDPNEKPLPDLNYKLTYPITVFDAVRADMYDQDSQTLTEALERIYDALRGKQQLIPAKSPNNIVTYGGLAGTVGSIEISTHIPYDGAMQSDFKIPTEKAVGDLLKEYGVIPGEGYTIDLFNFYIDEEDKLVIEYSGDETFYPVLYIDDQGNLILESNDTPFDIAMTQFFFNIIDGDLYLTGEDSSPTVFTVLWNRIVGRPTIYSGLGGDETGIISQAGITAAFNDVNTRFDEIWDEMDSSPLALRLHEHMSNTNNPHHLTPAIIGAVSRVEFDNHINDHSNPHAVTKAQVGLDQVDNTSDIDKPISRSTQAAIDQINTLISNITGLIGDISYVTNITYTQSNGRLDVRYNDGSTVGVTIVTDGLIDEIIPDKDNHALIVQELNGNQTTIDLQELILSYIGTAGTTIDVTIDENNKIAANIVPKSITNADIRDGSLINSLFATKTIGGDKIQDLTITARNIAAGTITQDKIASGTITGNKIDTHTITGTNIFTTSTANSVLAVTTANGDPGWSKVTSAMIASGAITASNVAVGAIIAEKIADSAIVSSKVASNAITTAKLANESVTSAKIKKGTITGVEFANNLIVPGSPSLATTPSYDATGKELINAEWVRYAITHIPSETIPDRSITGRKLFTSDIKNRVLAVRETNSDPVYTQINEGMMGDNAVNTNSIIDNAVTESKLHDDSVSTSKLAEKAVTSEKIADGEIQSVNIYESDTANTVLGVGEQPGHPAYRKVTNGMLAPDAVTEDKVADHSISANKVKNPDTGDKVLAYMEGDAYPAWTKITDLLIANRAITPDKMFSSSEPNMVLAVTTANTNPTWVKITDALVDHITFDSDSILPGAITHEKLALNSVDGTNIIDNSIGTEHIQDESVTKEKIFQPESNSRVLGKGKLDTEIDWIQIETDMLQDHIITPNKMWESSEAFTVLGTTEVGHTPDFVKLDENWFDDHTFSSRKLAENLMLYGTPTLENHPTENSNDHTIADTSWVRATVEAAIEAGGGGSADWHDIPDGALTTSKLEASPVKDRVVGVTEDNTTPVYTQVTEGMIENASVTRDKLDRSMELLGSPQVEIRPPVSACDQNGNGTLIPDVQWVKDEVHDQVSEAFEQYVPPQDRFNRTIGAITEERILELMDESTEAEVRPDIRDEFQNNVERVDVNALITAYEQGQYITTPSDDFYIRERTYEAIPISRIEGLIRGTITPKVVEDYDFEEVLPGPKEAVLGPKAVVTEYINDRAVTGAQLFTTPNENSVLAVTWPNEDPVWTKINHAMLGTGIIGIENFAPTTLRDRILGLDSNGVPTWVTISAAVLADGSVTERILADNSVTSNKIKDHSIGANKFADEPIFKEVHLFDGAVTTRKLTNKAVTSSKIANDAIDTINIKAKAVTSGKLEDAIVLPENASVKSASIDRKAVRNVTVSATLPAGCASGDVWLQYE